MKLRDALAQLASKGAGALEELSTRLDSWSNDVTGFGTTRDKTAYTVFGGVAYLSDSTLSNLYHGDDIAAKAVNIVPDTMLREGFVVDVGDQKANQELADAFEMLAARERYADGVRWGRCFGCGALLIGADDGRPASAPLDPEKSRGVSYLYELDKRLLWPRSWYTTPGHPKLGQAETYWVTSGLAHTDEPVAVVHETRLIMFGGANTGIWEREQNSGFDHSILQRAFEALRGFNTGYKAIEILLTDGSQAVFKMQGLAESLGADGTAMAQARMRVFDFYRSVLRAIVVDAGDPATGAGAEDFTRQQISLTGFPEMTDRMMLRISAAVEIPATILWGQSPAGMNATGESDFRGFYDRIRSEQQRVLAPRIRRLVRVMLQTKVMQGRPDAEAIKITFPPLWSEPPSVEATRKKTIAETDAIRINSGELLPEEVALVRGQPDGWDREIVLSDEGLAARRSVLESVGDDEDAAASTIELAPTDIVKVVTVNEARKSQGLSALTLEDGSEDPDGKLTVEAYAAKSAPAPSFGGGFGEEAKFDASDDDLVMAHIGLAERVLIVGGPRTGKSTLAARAGERFKRTVRGTDSLISKYEASPEAWSKASDEVARWLDEPGPWIVEGVAVPRALRKWLKTNPGKNLGATVVLLDEPKVEQTKSQRAMSRGVAKVWNEIAPEAGRRNILTVKR